MSVKLSHTVGFSAVVVDGAKIFPNFYKLKIGMLTMTENPIYQNVAIQRILLFIKEVLNGSVFIHAKNPIANKIKNLAKESRVIFFPEEPFDQIIALLLFHKFNAIVEGNFEIESIEIGSNISPDLRYIIEDFETFEFDETKVEFPWWQRPDTTTSDDPKILKNSNSWSDMNLDWNDKKDDAEVEFVLELDSDLNKPDVVVLDGGIDEGTE